MVKVKNPKIAFLFSGQGAQYSGMGAELSKTSEYAANVFKMADSVRPGTSDQCFNGTKEELSQTINTQPTLFGVDLAAAEGLKEHGIIPAAVAGFSLGEVAALSYSGSISYEDGMKLVCKRAEFMDHSSKATNSTMAAIVKLPSDEVSNICDKYDQIYPVNYNCSEQLVVAGVKGEFDDFFKEVKEAGGRGLPLPVSGGFHCPFMNDASENLRAELENYNFQAPEIPVYGNTLASHYPGDAGGIRGLLANQIINPVLWQKTIENMIADGISIFIEVGAGKTLSNLLKKISPTAISFNVENRETLMNTVTGLQNL